MEEIWKDIEGYEGLYQVSNLSRIKALAKFVNKGKCHRGWGEHLLRYGADACGYHRTNLSKNGNNRTVKVHRIVAQAFIPNPDNKPQVNHKDGNKQNNHIDNLEWCTQSENLKHAFRIGLKKPMAGENNNGHKLTRDQVEWIRKHYKNRHKEFSTVALGKRFGVHRKTITRIIRGYHWK